MKDFMEKLGRSTLHAEFARRMLAAIVDGPQIHVKPIAFDATLVQFECYGWSAEFAKKLREFSSHRSVHQKLLKYLSDLG